MDLQSSQVSQIPSVFGSNNTNLQEPATAEIQATAAKIQAWLIPYIAEVLEMEADKVNVTMPFESYGLDSSEAIGLTGDLEEWLGAEIDPNLLYNYPTIEALANHLASEVQV
ncbi:MAG: acyl carrier protein [Symploca sp. SIO2E6]|nr:acyl carrier protein [Symploca sp. SIO2E6]